MVMSNSAQQNRGNWYIPAGWTLTVLAVAAVVFRLYSRIFLTRSFGSDDCAIIIAAVRRSRNLQLPDNDILQVLTFVGEINDTFDVRYGYGRHSQYLTGDQISQIEKL